MCTQRYLRSRGDVGSGELGLPSILPVATLPVALVLHTCKPRAGSVDSLCYSEIWAPFQRLQEEGSES